MEKLTKRMEIGCRLNIRDAEKAIIAFIKFLLDYPKKVNDVEKKLDLKLKLLNIIKSFLGELNELFNTSI